jgi:DNA polymerase elongation subunit (family B)
MNALYGGLGTGKGGIFPESSPLASAITARGRSLIVMVKKTLEQRFWLLEGTVSGFEGEPPPVGAQPLRVLYGDTDSVMIHFPGCSLQQTAHHGQRLSTFFDTQMLKAPHTLAFEKILFPTAFYKVRSYRVRVRVL